MSILPGESPANGNRTLVIIPTFNERENIGMLIKRLFQLYPSVDVMVVDDSSRDGTAAAVEDLQGAYGNRLTLLVRSGKGGRGSAVLEGFKRGLQHGYDYLMEMDADFSHRPEEIATFFPLMEQCDCVVGSRYLPRSEIRDWGWKRTFFSHIANAFAKFILRMPLSDYTNGFRCYTRKAVEAVDPMNIDAKGYVVLSEVAYQLHKKGFRFGEVPTLFVNRRRGVSNLGFHEINEAFFSVLRIRWPWLSVKILDIATFAMRGMIGAGVDLAALAILLRFDLAPVPAFIFSSLIATAIMFMLRVRRWGAHAGLSAPAFLVLYGVMGVLVVLVSMGLLETGFHPLTAKAVAIVLLSPVSYVLSRRLLPR